MNIFEFLGSTVKREKPFQLVKHLNEVPASKIKFPIYGEVKHDGCFLAMAVKGVGAMGFSRTGKAFTNLGFLDDRYWMAPEGVYIAEICNDWMTLEELSGAINPNRVEPLDLETAEKMKYCSIKFRDFIWIIDFLKGRGSDSYLERKDTLWDCMETYLDHSDEMVKLKWLFSDEEMTAYSDINIGLGHEGSVFHQDVDWEAGHKGWREVKIVRGVSYDLECIGWEEGKGKYAGKVANLIFRWKDGKKIKAMLGKGWQHHHAEHLFNTRESIAGRIFKVTALQESSKGVLRLPKVGEERYDKRRSDF